MYDSIQYGTWIPLRYFRILSLRTREMAQQLKSIYAMAGTQSLFSAPMYLLMATYNSSSRGSNDFSYPAQE